MAVIVTGLADSTSIIHSLLRDQLLADCYRLDGVITTVDAVTGEATLDRQPEAIKQAAVADRLLLTKTDLAAPSAQAVLRARLQALNPAAPIIPLLQGEVSSDLLFNAGYYNPETKSVEVRRWLAAEAYADDNHDHEHDGRGHGHSHQSLDPNRHVDHIRSFCLVYDRPLDWGRFVARMQALIAAHGADLLRIKGMLNITGREAPVVVHGVQHLFHPPVLLDGWPDGDRRSRLVFITRSLDKAAVAKFFTSLQG